MFHAKVKSNLHLVDDAQVWILWGRTSMQMQFSIASCMFHTATDGLEFRIPEPSVLLVDLLMTALHRLTQPDGPYRRGK